MLAEMRGTQFFRGGNSVDRRHGLLSPVTQTAEFQASRAGGDILETDLWKIGRLAHFVNKLSLSLSPQI